MKQIEKALELAYTAHHGQLDKAGIPYILHPLTVAFSNVLDNDTQKTVAILHDVIEDTSVTFKDLKNMKFSDDVIDALQLLTRDKKGSYFAYIRKIRDSGNQDAYWVKFADLQHNMDITRIPLPTDKDYQRVEKYKKAIDILVRNIE